MPERPQPQPQSRVDDRDEVWRMLARLPRQQRTVLVLRYFEDLTEAQVAEVLGVSVGSVKNTASKGLARLRTDQSLEGFAMPQAPDGTERVAAVRERVARRRRARAATVAAAFAVVLALIAGYAFAHRPDRTHPVRPMPSPSAALSVGDYRDGYRVEARFQQAVTGDTTLLQYPVGLTGPVYTLECAPAVPTSHKIIAKLLTAGSSTLENSCGGDYNVTSTYGADEARRAQGSAVVIAFTVDGKPLNGDRLPVGVVVTLTIGERVPFEDYPLPPRPSLLATVPRAISGTEIAVLDAADGYTGTVPARNPKTSINVCVWSQTPGVFRVTADSEEIEPIELSLLSYPGDRCYVTIGPVRQTVVRATAEHVTGEWVVWITTGTVTVGLDPAVRE